MIPRIIALSTKLQKYGLLKSIAAKPEKRYQDYKPFRKHIFRSLVPFANKISTELIQSQQIDRAIRVNAEICFSKGTGYIDLQWKERILLVGLLALYSKNNEQAANWLSAGVNLQKNKLISRCCTYGFSQQFIKWVLDNEQDMTTPQGWIKIIESSNKSNDEFLSLILSIATMVQCLGLKGDVKALLSHIKHPNVQDWKKILNGRIAVQRSNSEPSFSPKQIWSGSFQDIHQKILLNIFKRVFSKPNKSKTFVTQDEYDWLIANGYDFVADHHFYLLCRAFQLVANKNPAAVKTLLKEEFELNADFFDDLLSREGPLRIFVGGYGWTGSGAVFDSFRGYPNVKEMTGAGEHVPYLNEGADSEPMLHQGPAGILPFANQIKKNGNITIAMWKRFFRLYVLTELSHSYFEYKTIHANKLIRDQISPKNYNLILLKNIADHAKISSIKVKKKRRAYRMGVLKRFEANVVKSIFKNDDDVVLFNNSVNTHNVRALRHLAGRSVYIAVNRSIFDQLADQRRSNIFFNASVMKFARVKSTKIRSYFSAKKSVEHIAGISFYNIQFEDWVQDDAFRAQTSKEILGSFSKQYDSKFFTPSQSAKNVNIYDHKAHPKETKLINVLRIRNKHL